MKYSFSYSHMQLDLIIRVILSYYLFLPELQYLLTSCVQTTEDWTANDIDIAFHDANLVPTNVPKNPANICTVEFEDRSLNLGTMMEVSEIEKKPKVDWFAESNSLYTLYVPVLADWTFHDSRAETKSKEAVFIRHEWHQWIVTNIPGNKLHLGDEVYPYKSPPLPHKLDASITFVYLIYKQKDIIEVAPPQNITEGYRINELGYLKDFIKKYKLGKCVAGNFLEIDWEFTANYNTSTLSHDDFANGTSTTAGVRGFF